MVPTTTLQHSYRLKLCFAVLSLSAAAAQAQTVYRCPGTPVIYTDQISAQEARTRGCRPIESRWFEVGGNSETMAFADTQSMRRNGSKVKVWLRWANTKSSETNGYPKKTYFSEKALAIYDCADRKSATIQVIRYSDTDASGEVVESISIPEASAAFRDLAPETIGENILEYVCTATALSKK